MNILVTGGTGTLGKVLLPKLASVFSVDRIRVLSRDEHKQVDLSEKLEHLPIDWLIGDVRDRERVWYAMKGCSLVFHLAAVKSVDKAEYDPNEAIQTNINGSQNVIDACIKHNVKKAIITSTDKACAPLNVYGATKLVAEKLFVNSNSYAGKDGTVFGAVRYGNVLGSNGSVLQKWDRSEKPLMTEPSMTRFWISKEDAADFVINSMVKMGRGEVRIPKMKSCSMDALFKAWKEATGSSKAYSKVGIRPGEKMDEKLFSQEEVHLVTNIKEAWVKWPSKPSYPVEKWGDDVLSEVTSKSAPEFKHQDLVEAIKCI